MSAAGTAKAKGITTKSMAAAHAAAEKMGAVIVQLPNGGNTLVSKAEAERRNLIDKAKADLAKADEVKDGVPADQKKGKSGATQVPAAPTTLQETIAANVAQEVAEGKLTPVGPAPREKKPYNPSPLAGAPAAGKAPAKGQLPLALLRKLVERNPNSEKLRAALAAAEGGSAVAAKKGKKAKK